MVKLILCLLSAVSLFAAGSAYKQNSTTSRTIAAIGDFEQGRLEGYIEWVTCDATMAAGGQTFFRMIGMAGIGCYQNGSTSVKIGSESGLTSTAVSGMVAGTRYIVRLERQCSTSTITFTVFKEDGTILNSGTATDTCDVSGGTKFTLGSGNFFPASIGAGFSYAWVRGYSTLSTDPTIMPKNTETDTTGLLFNYTFEGDLTDSSGNGRNLSPNVTTASNCFGSAGDCFVSVPTAAMVIQAQKTNTVAGQIATFTDASVTFDGTAISNCVWQWKSGPAAPFISNRRACTTTVSRLVEGNHVFTLSVLGSVPKDIAVTITNLDANGIPIFPTNVFSSYITQPLQIPRIRNAVDVKMTVRLPSGGLLTPVICPTSPCQAPIDIGQGSHSLKLEYRNNLGTTLNLSDWQIASSVQTSRAPVSSDEGGQTHSKFGAWFSANRTASAMRLQGQTWVATTGAGVINGSDDIWRLYNPSIPNLQYKDPSIYPKEFWEHRYPLDLLGIPHELMFTHFMRDSRWSDTSYYWNGLDRFGRFNVPTQFKDGNYTDSGYTKGVMTRATADVGDYIDITSTAYNTNTSLSGVGEIAFCSAEPFDFVGFRFQTAGSGCSVSWQYANTNTPAYSSLTVTDGTSNLSQGGYVRFNPPADWAQVTYRSPDDQVNWKLWCVRALVSSCSVAPTTSRMFGDDYMVSDDEVVISSNSASAIVGSTTVSSPYTTGKLYKILPSTGIAAAANATINLNSGGTKRMYERDGTTSIALTSGTPYWIEYDSTLNGGAGGFKKWPKFSGWCAADINGSDRISSIYTYSDGSPLWTYDPTPGSYCSARFKHQSRVFMPWSGNMAWQLDKVNTYNGISVGAYALANLMVPRMKKGRTGVIYNTGVAVDNVQSKLFESSRLLPGEVATPDTPAAGGATPTTSKLWWTHEYQPVIQASGYTASTDDNNGPYWGGPPVRDFLCNLKTYLRANSGFESAWIGGNSNIRPGFGRCLDLKLFEGAFTQNWENLVSSTVDESDPWKLVVVGGKASTQWQQYRTGSVYAYNLQGQRILGLQMIDGANRSGRNGPNKPNSGDCYGLYNAGTNPDGCSSFTPYVEGERGTMLGLSRYYMYSEDGTAMNLTNAGASAIYNRGDEYKWWPITPDTTLANSISQQLTVLSDGSGRADMVADPEKAITLTDSSTFPNTGTIVFSDAYTYDYGKCTGSGGQKYSTGGNVTSSACTGNPANTIVVSNYILADETAGTGVSYLRSTSLSTAAPNYSTQRIQSWGTVAPVMWVSVGKPCTSAAFSGCGGVTTYGLDYAQFVSAATANTWPLNPVYRRDFTRAIVLFVGGENQTGVNWQGEATINDDANPIALGGTFYPLLTSGKTSAGITSITPKRAKWGAVLMREPIN